jgi:hypothetical protein
MLNPDHKWIERIKLGDVLKSRSGDLRVVRWVRHSPIPYYGIRTSVIFAIRRTSWTTPAYTVYTGNDLVQMGYRPTRAKHPLTARIDKRLLKSFEHNGGILPTDLRAWDVIGLP